MDLALPELKLNKSSVSITVPIGDSVQTSFIISNVGDASANDVSCSITGIMPTGVESTIIPDNLGTLAIQDQIPLSLSLSASLSTPDGASATAVLKCTCSNCRSSETMTLNIKTELPS